MKIKLYIDVLFTVNAWADLGLLILTGRIMRVTAARHRLLLAACFGGIWSCVLPFLEIPTVLEVLFTAGIAGPVLCRIAFGRQSRRFFVRAVINLLLSAIFFGGTLTLLRFHTGLGYVTERFFHETDGAADLLLFGLLITFAVLLGKAVLLFFRAQREEHQRNVPIRIQRGEREITVRALLDTGNLLMDPATGLPVSVGEREVFAPLFSEANGVLMIPYRTVGGNGLLEGRIADQMVFLAEDGTVLGVKPGPVLIGLKEGALTSDGSFQLILPGSFAEMTAWKGKRRKKHGHQSCSSKQISVKNHFQHEEPFICPEKRGALYRRKRGTAGTVGSGGGSADDRQTGNLRGKGGKGGTDRT